MRLKSFLQDKLFYIVSQIIFGILIFNVFSLFEINFRITLLVMITLILFTVATVTVEYLPRKNYYSNILNLLDELEEKHYISQIIKEPLFEDGKIIFNVLKQTDKSMNDEIEKYRKENANYKEYIETWIHEIKTPIAALELMFKKDKNAMMQLRKIDNYVEQALYYAKVSNLEKDYIVRKINLQQLIRKVLKNRSDELIFNKATIKLDGIDNVVFSDSKWLEFILNQIITNSIKYKKNKLILQFNAENFEEKLVLNIIDNGIGIDKRDLHNIFEKGHTGYTGREYNKSTGIGLYLCKKLCDSMFLGIEVESKKDEYTNVKITFPKSEELLNMSKQ